MIPRSYLYVPGDQPDKLAAAASRGADALILDLEDAVSPARRPSARATVADYLTAGTAWVRVTADDVATDLAAITGRPGLAGIVVPKAEPELLAEVDALLAALPTLPVLALIETARGVRRLDEVADSPRVVRLGIGESDLAGELGLRPGPERIELWPIRSDVVTASVAAGLAAPVGPVDRSVHDQTRLAESTDLLLRQGFRARTAIHPAQLATINDVFTPTADEVAAARETLAKLAAAPSGVTVDSEGRLLDPAVVRVARETLDRAGFPNGDDLISRA